MAVVVVLVLVIIDLGFERDCEEIVLGVVHADAVVEECKSCVAIANRDRIKSADVDVDIDADIDVEGLSVPADLLVVIILVFSAYKYSTWNE